MTLQSWSCRTYMHRLGMDSARGGLALPLVRQRRIFQSVFTFVESSIFARILPSYLDDDEYSELQQYLMRHPEAGDIVPGSGGVRKMRWALPGTGKRGGLRIIYFVRYRPNEFWMLTLYAKSKRENVPAHILKQLVEAFQNE